MENSMTGITKLLMSLFVFVSISVAVGGIAYQFFTPDGYLMQWGKDMWATHPLSLLFMGVSCFLFKRWLDGLENGGLVADVMVYLAVVVGVFFGITLLVTA